MICECPDSDCPLCEGVCEAEALMLLVRVDMDHIGRNFCEACGTAALESGLFTEGR